MFSDHLKLWKLLQSMSVMPEKNQNTYGPLDAEINELWDQILQAEVQLHKAQRFASTGDTMHLRDPSGQFLLTFCAFRNLSKTIKNLVILLFRRHPEGKKGERFLNQIQPGTGWTALHAAAMMGHVETVETLLGFADTNPNVQDHQGRTPVMLSQSPHLPKAQREQILALFEKNPRFDVSLCDRNGCDIFAYKTHSEMAFPKEKTHNLWGHTFLIQQLMALLSASMSQNFAIQDAVLKFLQAPEQRKLWSKEVACLDDMRFSPADWLAHLPPSCMVLWLTLKCALTLDSTGRLKDRRPFSQQVLRENPLRRTPLRMWLWQEYLHPRDAYLFQQCRTLFFLDVAFEGDCYATLRALRDEAHKHRLEHAYTWYERHCGAIVKQGIHTPPPEKHEMIIIGKPPRSRAEWRKAKSQSPQCGEKRKRSLEP